MTIEDIILGNDRRGISELRSHLPAGFCDQAAQLILDNPGPAIVVTGFYLLVAEITETDGPPGAVAIGDALQSLGREVVYVSDRYTVPLLTGLRGSEARVVDFPITDVEASRKFASDLLAEIDPSIVIAIERCGLTEEGLFRNSKGLDISEYNAKTDYLFEGHPATVGIGDGGNEVGMGNLASVITTVPSLVKMPTVTTTTRLILSSVSNWGGYGLVASLSQGVGRNLLPSVEKDRELIKQTVSLGAADGMSNKRENKVDGFTLEENGQLVESLHGFLAEQGISS